MCVYSSLREDYSWMTKKLAPLARPTHYTLAPFATTLLTFDHISSRHSEFVVCGL